MAISMAAVSVTGLSSTAEARSGSCPQYEGLLAANNMPVSTFSRIMFRESGCQARVRSRTRDTGLLQINDVNHRWLSRRLGTHVTVAWLKNPANNVRAAAALYRTFGTRPWVATR
jgi:soluble lytic murein transglycosylase-like protein